MSDTPRTDAEQYDSQPGNPMFPGGHMVVPAALARQFERELADEAQDCARLQLRVVDLERELAVLQAHVDEANRDAPAAVVRLEDALCTAQNRIGMLELDLAEAQAKLQRVVDWLRHAANSPGGLAAELEEG